MGCSQCLKCLEFLYLSENDPTLLLSVFGMSGVQLTKVEAEVRTRFLDNLAVALVPALFRIRILRSVLLANGPDPAPLVRDL